MPELQASFPTTRWTLVVPREATPSARATAAQTLCELYWRPVHICIRRMIGQGRADEDAEDLTQQFFAGLAANGFVLGANPAKGRLRSYLLGAIKHHVALRWRHANALKRGGHVGVTTLGEDSEAVVSPNLSPDEAFDRSWAECLLESALLKLRHHYTGPVREAQYRVLRSLLLQGEPATGASVASEAVRALGLSGGALRVALHRFRTRYRRILRSEIEATLQPGECLEEEVAYLVSLLSNYGGLSSESHPGCNTAAGTDQ